MASDIELFARLAADIEKSNTIPAGEVEPVESIGAAAEPPESNEPEAATVEPEPATIEPSIETNETNKTE